jgi:hypothetical protein
MGRWPLKPLRRCRTLPDHDRARERARPSLLTSAAPSRRFPPWKSLLAGDRLAPRAKSEAKSCAESDGISAAGGESRGAAPDNRGAAAAAEAVRAG